MYICTYISIYLYICMEIYEHICICMYIYIQTHTTVLYIYMYSMCVSVCICLCMYSIYLYPQCHTETQSTVCMRTRTGLKIVSFACRARCSLILETRQLLKVRRSGCRRRKLSVWKSFQPVTQPITDIFLEIEVSLIQSAVLLRLVMRCQKTKDEDRLLQILYYFYTHGCFPGYIKTAKYGLLVLSCLFFQLLDVFEKSSHM